MRHFVLVAIAAVVIAIVLVEVGHGLCVVGGQLLLGDLVDPGAHELAQELPASLPPDGLGDDPDGVLRLDEAQGHGRTVGKGPDGAADRVARATPARPRVPACRRMDPEAAETGEVRAPPGLPTTDELSIRNVDIAGDRATARLAGGERLVLRRSGGRWRVKRVLSVR